MAERARHPDRPARRVTPAGRALGSHVAIVVTIRSFVSCVSTSATPRYRRRERADHDARRARAAKAVNRAARRCARNAAR